MITIVDLRIIIMLAHTILLFWLDYEETVTISIHTNTSVAEEATES